MTIFNDRWKDTYNWIKEINNQTEHIIQYDENNLDAEINPHICGQLIYNKVGAKNIK